MQPSFYGKTSFVTIEDEYSTISSQDEKEYNEESTEVEDAPRESDRDFIASSGSCSVEVVDQGSSSAWSRSSTHTPTDHEYSDCSYLGIRFPTPPQPQSYTTFTFGTGTQFQSYKYPQEKFGD